MHEERVLGKEVSGARSAIVRPPPEMWGPRLSCEAPASPCGRDFWPVLTVSDPFEGPFTGEVQERLGGLKT